MNNQEKIQEIKTTIEKLQNQVKELEEQKEGKYVPKVGESYLYIDEYGNIYHDTNDDSLFDDKKIALGNCFETREKAELELLRRQSIANAWIPKETRRVYFWNFIFDCVDSVTYDIAFFPWTYIGAVHRTEKECQAWYNKYGKAFVEVMK